MLILNCSFQYKRVCEHSELFERVRCDADQLRAAELIASQPVIVLSGKGGCGKTEVVSAVVSYAVAKINSEKYVIYIIPGSQSNSSFYGC